MKRLIIFLLLFAGIKVAGQTIGHLRFDTVMIYKVGGTAELVLLNKTKDTLGVLTNYGNGRTRFIKSRAINDSTIVVGLDTMTVRGASGFTADNGLTKTGSNVQLGGALTGNTSISGTNLLTIDARTKLNNVSFRKSNTGDANYIITSNDFYIELDITTAQRTITFPSPAGDNTGRVLWVADRDESVNDWQITGNVVDINDPSSARIAFVDSLRSYQLISDGTNWVIHNIYPGESAGGAGDNANAGAGYRILKPGTQEMKTLFDGYGILTDSTTNTNGLTRKVDTTGANGVVTRSELLDSTDKVTQVRSPVWVLPGADRSIPDTITVLYDGTLDTTASGELTVNPAILPSPNPGLYFGPAQNANPGFMVLASAIVRPTNSFSHGTDIVYDIINYTSDHNSSFFDSAYGHVASTRLYIRYPNVKYVYNSAVLPDEVFALQNIIAGPSTGLTIMQIAAYRNYPVGYTISGNGAGTWTVAGSFASAFSASTHNTSTGITGFNVSGASLWGTDYNGINIAYVGTSNYHIQRAAAFGAYNIAFKLVDEFNNPVTINPATTDQISITNCGLQSFQLNLAQWITGSNAFMNTSSNFWVWGLFEAWMVAAATSTTAINVRWQTDYPSATTYKIYRSSTGLYGTFTLVHTGTSGSFTDTGLTPNTLYTYKMVAVVGGIDTDVTTFNANTKF